jgi:hypothetical protein
VLHTECCKKEEERRGSSHGEVSVLGVFVWRIVVSAPVFLCVNYLVLVEKEEDKC